MHRTTLDLEFVTPCFCGGAPLDTIPGERRPRPDSPKFAARPEWRAQSVRGQLRWWFRALAGPDAVEAAGGLRQLETFVFGDTERPSALRIETLGSPDICKIQPGRKLGKGVSAHELADAWKAGNATESFDAAIERLKITRLSQGRRVEVMANPLLYLGYGPLSHKGLLRGFIEAGETVQLRITAMSKRWSNVPGTARQLFSRALRAWLLLGGLGSRSRNGWGSLAVQSSSGASAGDAEWLDGHQLSIRNRDDYIAACRDLLKPYAEMDADVEDLEWTRFSRHTRIYVGVPVPGDAQAALSRVGAWLIAFRRRYGRPGELRTRDLVPLKDRDYAWAAPNGGKRKEGLPDRAGFGLPLPFGERGETVTWFDPDNQNRSGDPRRASPLHIHVARAGEKFFPVLTYIPSRFLPGRGEVQFKNGGTRSPSRPPTAQQLDIVERFLDDLESKKDLIDRVMP